jgi:thiol-disulfide isomerase/thioredoxin
MNRLAGLLLVALFLISAPLRAGGAEVVGRPAPAWTELRWLGPPQTTALRSQVVLVRWWSDECPLCKSTLPGLGKLYAAHRKDGLMVVGVYHPKPQPKAVAAAEVKKYAAALGVQFPVAIDADWTVLKRWWLKDNERSFTSVSFLVDRQGIIRWMHRGGEFHESLDPEHKACNDAWQELRRVLPVVLGER